MFVKTAIMYVDDNTNEVILYSLQGSVGSWRVPLESLEDGDVIQPNAEFLWIECDDFWRPNYVKLWHIVPTNLDKEWEQEGF